jgi:hypothetical protein
MASRFIWLSIPTYPDLADKVAVVTGSSPVRMGVGGNLANRG